MGHSFYLLPADRLGRAMMSDLCRYFKQLGVQLERLRGEKAVPSQKRD